MTTDIAGLQLLPEIESMPAGAHVAWPCQLTCPWDTSDSVPSFCCDD